jgi:hypothetical protein
MDPSGAMEERVVTDRIRRKLEEVNAAAQQQLAGVQDHVNFTMQVKVRSAILGFRRLKIPFSEVCSFGKGECGSCGGSPRKGFGCLLVLMMGNSWVEEGANLVMGNSWVEESANLVLMGNSWVEEALERVS